MGSQVFNIGGMTCAACAQRIERVVGKLPGIDKASVNLANESLFVSCGNDIIPEDIIRAVTKLGFTASLPKKDDASNTAAVKEKEIRTLRIKFIISVIFALPLLYIAMAPMTVILPFPEMSPLAYGISQLILVIPIILAGNKFYTVGFKSLFMKSPNMDSLIAVGTTAAFIYSMYNITGIIRGERTAAHSLYFETAGVIITLVLLGKTLEAISKGKTGEAVKKLMELAPKTAVILRDGIETEIPANEVKPGDIVVIKPGGAIPVDGVVTEGFTSVSEAALTGESMPLNKKPGDYVYAASINTTGAIRFRAEKVGNDTTLARIIHLVEDAQGKKAPIARTADIVSGYFVPVVCIIAAIAGIAWFFGSLYFPETLPSDTTSVGFGLTVFISVLVIACPCALGLATPAAIMVATGKGAEYGVLFKSGEALETTHKLDVVVFDKTGTVTEGKPSVTDIYTTGDITGDILLKKAASAEKDSEHPLGQAIVRAAQEKGMEFLNTEDFISVTGHGITAKTGGEFLVAGNRKLMEEHNISLTALEKESDRLSQEGKTPVYIASNGKLSGIIAVADTIKESSGAAIQRLYNMGISVVMLTGDNKKTAEAIAKQVGIDNVRSEVLPQDKWSEIKKLQEKGHKVAMVGDGINDAPALAGADIGIAIGSGTDIAIESADIVLMRSDISDVPLAIELSRKTIRNIKQNLVWAFGYNVIGIPVAAGILHLFGGPLLSPMFGAAAMSLSSVSVVTNALRLKNFKPHLK